MKSLVRFFALLAVFGAFLLSARSVAAKPQGAGSPNGISVGNGSVRIHYEVTTTTESTKEQSVTTTATGEYIQSYASRAEVQKDGSIIVTERLLYHFPEPRHGIFRTIPYVKPNENGKQYAMSIEDFSVADENNNPYQFSVSDSGGVKTYKIGDPDRTIEGLHWYILRYTVKGALTYFPGHDELYWNAVGTAWQIPILTATAVISMPEALPPAEVQANCFVGNAGSKETFCTTQYKNGEVTVTADRVLTAGEGLTYTVGFPKGTVAVLEPTEVIPWYDTPGGKILLVVIAVAAFLWYIVAPIFVIVKWWRSGRDPKPAMGEVSAWFAPPKTPHRRPLTPAETGTLVDEKADLRDIYASIIDLARRGYLKIIETKKNTFAFEKVKDWDTDTDLLPFERELLSGIFATKEHVNVSSLDIAKTLEKVKSLLYESLVSDKFFPSNPNTLRGWYVALGIIALVFFNPVLLLVSLVFGQAMPRKTLFGAEQAMIARSLKNFLVSQDKQLAFQAKNQLMFEKLLPYAVAFGVEAIWAERFKELGLKNPEWYQSSTGSRFNSVVFAHSIGRGMSVSFAASISAHASTGHSSGFSSGGGFSGGGGGGGGGGSW
jgi:hypothetical protein